jgi:hypothetical protein
MRRWAGRVAAVVAAAFVAVIFLAGIALANDTCTADQKGDCRNTAAVIGTGATVTVVVTTVIVIHRRDTPRAKSCEELMARIGIVQNKMGELLQQVQGLARVQQSAMNQSMLMEREYERLLAEHQGIMGYFLAAGALAIAALVVVGAGFCLRLSQFFAQRSSMIDPGTRAFWGYLSELPPGSLGTMEATFRAGYPALLRMEAANAARATAWRSLSASLARMGAASGASLFAIREKVKAMMEGDLAAVRASMDTNERMIRDLEQARTEKRTELIRLMEEFDELRERILRDCGIEIKVTQSAPLPPAPRRPVEGGPIRG